MNIIQPLQRTEYYDAQVNTSLEKFIQDRKTKLVIDQLEKSPKLVDSLSELDFCRLLYLIHSARDERAGNLFRTLLAAPQMNDLQDQAFTPLTTDYTEIPEVLPLEKAPLETIRDRTVEFLATDHAKKLNSFTLRQVFINFKKANISTDRVEVLLGKEAAGKIPQCLYKKNPSTSWQPCTIV